LEVRLQCPTGIELRGVANLKELFERARDEKTGIEVEAMHPIGYARPQHLCEALHLREFPYRAQGSQRARKPALRVR
jgi:hypothetical protein